MTYTLIDTDTGNLIGTYATEQEALTLIQSAIGAHGTEYADPLALGQEDTDGHAMVIAEGHTFAVPLK